MLPHFISHCKSQQFKMFLAKKYDRRGSHREGTKPLKIRDVNDDFPGKVELAYLLMSICDWM